MSAILEIMIFGNIDFGNVNFENINLEIEGLETYSLEWPFSATVQFSPCILQFSPYNSVLAIQSLQFSPCNSVLAISTTLTIQSLHNYNIMQFDLS